MKVFVAQAVDYDGSVVVGVYRSEARAWAAAETACREAKWGSPVPAVDEVDFVEEA